MRDITVAIVTYNAAKHLSACLESVLKQAPHGGALEILVVDGCSTDGTQDVARRFGERVRLVENPKCTIASNRNVALREARHPYIAFTDSDCIVRWNWLCSLSHAFQDIQMADRRVAGVGGGNIVPSGQNPFYAALGIALDSFLGSMGSVQAKVFEDQRQVSSLAGLNVLYERAALVSAGGFDEQLENMGEDLDMNYRLGQYGRTLYYIPNANVVHFSRLNLRAWCVNMYAYGKGRATLMRKHRTLFSPAYVLPIAFLPTLMAGTLCGVSWPWAFAVWLYVPAMMLAGVALSLNEGTIPGWRVGAVLLGTHFFYAFGMCYGLIRRIPRPVRSGPVST